MSFRELGPQEYQAEYQQNEQAVLLDVRRPEEYEAGHIPGAIHMNIEDPSFVENVASLDPNKTYYVNCRSGGRSGRACQYMQTKGIANVINLRGGMMDWEVAGLPVKTGMEA